MAEQLKLSNGLEFLQHNLRYYSDDGPETHRLFIPKSFQKFRTSQLLEKTKQIYNYFDEGTDYLGLFIDYYSISISGLGGIQALTNPQNKYTRSFNPNHLLLMEEFNQEIRLNNLRTPNQIWSYVKKKSILQKADIYKKIKKKTLDKLVDWTTPLHEIIEATFKAEPVANPFHSELDFQEFIALELSRFTKIINYFEEDKSPDFSDEDYDYVRNNMQESEEKALVLNDEKLLKLKLRIDLIIAGINNLEKLNTDGEIINRLTINIPDTLISEIDSIFKELFDRLQEMTIYRKKDNLKSHINDLLRSVEESLAGTLSAKLICLYQLKNYFVDYNSARVSMLNSIEPIYRENIRFSNKEALKQLMKEQNLTKAERRLYILFNIGVKKLAYMTCNSHDIN